jgi:hypothetical protein
VCAVGGERAAACLCVCVCFNCIQVLAWAVTVVKDGWGNLKSEPDGCLMQQAGMHGQCQGGGGADVWGGRRCRGEAAYVWGRHGGRNLKWGLDLAGLGCLANTPASWGKRALRPTMQLHCSNKSRRSAPATQYYYCDSSTTARDTVHFTNLKHAHWLRPPLEQGRSQRPCERVILQLQ